MCFGGSEKQNQTMHWPRIVGLKWKCVKRIFFKGEILKCSKKGSRLYSFDDNDSVAMETEAPEVVVYCGEAGEVILDKMKLGYFYLGL